MIVPFLLSVDLSSLLKRQALGCDFLVLSQEIFVAEHSHSDEKHIPYL